MAKYAGHVPGQQPAGGLEGLHHFEQADAPGPQVTEHIGWQERMTASC
jgi:hypothetical protein